MNRLQKAAAVAAIISAGAAVWVIIVPKTPTGSPKPPLEREQNEEEQRERLVNRKVESLIKKYNPQDMGCRKALRNLSTGSTENWLNSATRALCPPGLQDEWAAFLRKLDQAP